MRVCDQVAHLLAFGIASSEKPRKLELQRRIEEDTAKSVQFRLLRCFFGRSIRGTFARSIEGGVFLSCASFDVWWKKKGAHRIFVPNVDVLTGWRERERECYVAIRK